MRLLDFEAFSLALETYDDSVVRKNLGEFGIANVPEESQSIMTLFRPFLAFIDAETPADVEVPAEELADMAGCLSELVGIFTTSEMIDGETASRNLDSVKGIKRRRVL